MTTQDLINNFLNKGVATYKKNSKNSLEARKLNRHETVIIDGCEFNYWREYVVYRMAEWIASHLPELKREDIQVTLNGNESELIVFLSDSEQEKINTLMTEFLKTV